MSTTTLSKQTMDEKTEQVKPSPKIKSLEIENFRGIKKCKIEKLGKINIFLGRNSVGKTTVLEAAWLCAINGADKILNMDIFRERILTLPPLRENNDFVTPFYNLDTKNIPKILVQKKNNDLIQTIIEPLDNLNQQNKVVNLGSKNDQNYLQQMSNEIQGYKLIKKKIEPNDSEILLEANLYNEYGNYRHNIQRVLQDYKEEYNFRFLFDKKLNIKDIEHLIRNGKKEELINLLKKINFQIKGIDILNNTLNVDIAAEQLLPAHFTGDGVMLMATIFANLYRQKEGFLLIDELENGLHYKSQELVWEVIAQQSLNYNVDCFITTHSDELLKSLNAFLKKEENKQYRDLFMIHTLFHSKDKEELKVKSKNYENFSQLIDEDFELRGLF